MRSKVLWLGRSIQRASPADLPLSENLLLARLGQGLEEPCNLEGIAYS